MTDNRTTELREKLDDLIIELDRLDIALDSPASDMTIGEYEQEREKLLDGFMQAIAATLGSGTLTAEQVERVIHDCSTYASYDGCTYYASGIKLQAIADELNTELGSGTCEDISNDPTGFECSKCGVSLAYDEISYNHDWDDPATVRFCPNCGKRVSA